MKNRRLMLNVLVAACLWYANSALTAATLDPDSCYRVCDPWVSCDYACIVGTETWSTCGAEGYTCAP